MYGQPAETEKRGRCGEFYRREVAVSRGSTVVSKAIDLLSYTVIPHAS